MSLPTNITVGDPDHAGIHNAERSAINAKPDDFVDLGDTPSSLAGEAGKTLVVNTAGTALELASPSGVTVKNSIEDDGGDLQLVGDAATPGGSRYYGTDGAGAKGFHELPSGGEGGDVPSPHALGGVHHSADTLANLNSKISDATLDDASATRTPAEHGNEAHSEMFVTAADLSVVTANVQTASYTLVIGDAGKAVEMNVATANNVTVPPNSSVAFPVGTVVEVAQVGAGKTTIAEGSGVDVRTPATLVLTGQWSTVSLRKRATDEWVLAGDVEDGS
jgi:hypothetical protein